MTSAVRWLIPGMVSSRRNGSAHGAMTRSISALRCVFRTVVIAHSDAS
jgi:hypothetical protein